MNVYEEEFGDLLVVHQGRTVQQQFYSDNIKRLVTLYSFLPAELLERRMQKYWEKFLERNPHIRKKHKAEMKAIQALCPGDNLSKVPQRKWRQHLGANLQRARTPQQAAKRTTGGSNAQANISRPQNRKKGAVEQRYVPLEIRVTRSPPATAEPDKLSTAANQAAEEPEEAEKKRMNEDLPAISETAATKMGNASEQNDGPRDIVTHFEADDTDSDSEYGDFPPLLSRMHVAASDAASDDEFEHALDDDFPPLETP